MLLLLACAASDGDTGVVTGPEGAFELDTAQPLDTSDTAPEDTGDTGVAPSNEQVCYPGADGAWTTCLPLVDWQAGWGADYAYPDPMDGSALYRAPIRFVDLSEGDPGVMLAANFALSELMQEHKGRYGVFQPHAVERIQALRERVGGPVTINSGYRNVTYNAGVGGATWSRHMYGDALDMRSSAASLDALAGHCEALGAGYIGWYETHIHCDWRDDPLDEAFFGPAPPPWNDRIDGCENEDGPPRRSWRATSD